MDTTITTTTTSLFFSIFRNKYLSHLINGYIIIGNEYLSLSRLFVENRFHHFDIKWNQYIKHDDDEFSSPMDLSDYDIKMFMLHNKCYHRFNILWPTIKLVCTKTKSWIKACCRGGGVDRRITKSLIDHLFETVPSQRRMIYQSQEILKDLDDQKDNGGSSSIDILEYFLEKKYNYSGVNSNSSNSTETTTTTTTTAYWRELSNNISHKNIEIGKYVVKKIYEYGPIGNTCYLDFVSKELIQYILDFKDVDKKITLSFNSFPPKNIENALLLINHQPKINLLILYFDLPRAKKKGNQEIINYINQFRNNNSKEYPIVKNIEKKFAKDVNKLKDYNKQQQQQQQPLLQ